MRSKNKKDGQIVPSFIETVRRTQIIESAIETLATMGYAQASLAQIAQHAGISKGVISYYFANKEALIEQIVPEVYAAGARFMTPQIEAQTNASDMLRVYIQSNIAFIGTHRAQMMAVIEIMINFRPENGKLRYDVVAEESVLADVERILSFGQRTGEFRPFDKRVMAITIRKTIDALPLVLAANPDLDLNVYTQELVTLFQRATQKDEEKS